MNANPDQARAGEVVDLAIVGGGPTGLFAAFYAGLRGMSTLIIDSLEQLGGQLTTLYPEKYIYDVAGFPKVLAKDLVTQLVEQAMVYSPTVALGQEVRDLTYDPQTKIYGIQTNQRVRQARTILVAAGVGAFEPKRLKVPGADELEGRGIHYFVQSTDYLRDKRILIVGGGDSAVDWANTLAPSAREITLIHRSDRFRAHEQSVRHMRQSPIRIETFHELKEVGGQGALEYAIIINNRAKTERRLDIDAVLVNIGFISSLGALAGWNLEMEGGQIVVDSMMHSSRPGIFGAGDVITYPGKLKLIATGFGEAAVAVNYAKHYLDPAANIFPGHSTNLKKP
jgi:thioredoxin reductase (NADPH)